MSTPAEPAGPTFTASGRQVKSRVGGHYGEIMHSGQQDTRQADEDVDMDGTAPDDADGGRATRSGQPPNGRPGAHIKGYNVVDEIDDESDAASSGNEWDGGDEDVDDNIADEEDEDEDMSDDSDANDGNDTGHLSQRSLVISLKVPQDKTMTPAPSFEKSEVVMANGDSPAESISLIDDGALPLDSEDVAEADAATGAAGKLSNGESHALDSEASDKIEPLAAQPHTNTNIPMHANGQTSATSLKPVPVISAVGGSSPAHHSKS